MKRKVNDINVKSINLNDKNNERAWKKKIHRFRIYMQEKGKMKGSYGSSYTTLALTKNFGGLFIGF